MGFEGDFLSEKRRKMTEKRVSFVSGFIFYSNQTLALDPAWPIRLIFIAFTRNSLEIGRVKGRTEGKRREGEFEGEGHATTIFIFNLSQL